MLAFKKYYHIMFFSLYPTYNMLPFKKCYHIMFIQPLFIYYPNRCYLSKKVIIFCSPSHYPTTTCCFYIIVMILCSSTLYPICYSHLTRFYSSCHYSTYYMLPFTKNYPTYYMQPFKKCYYILFIQPLSNLLHPPFIQSATAILPDSTHPVITQPTICCLSQKIIQPTTCSLSKNVIIFCSSSHYPTTTCCFYIIVMILCSSTLYPICYSHLTRFYSSCHYSTYYMLPFTKCYHILYMQPLSNLLYAAFHKMLSYSVHPAIIQPNTCCISKNFIIFCSSSHHPTYYMLPFKKCYHILFIQPLSNLLHAAFQKNLSQSVHPAII